MRNIFKEGLWRAYIASAIKIAIAISKPLNKESENLMFTLAELRNKFRAVSPLEALEYLDSIFKSGKLPDDYRPPLMTIWLASGSSFRGYLIDARREKDHAFVFSQEIVTDADDAADICYVYGSRIEAVTIWDVDDHPEGLLPRPK